MTYLYLCPISCTDVFNSGGNVSRFRRVLLAILAGSIQLYCEYYLFSWVWILRVRQVDRGFAMVLMPVFAEYVVLSRGFRGNLK